MNARELASAIVAFVASSDSPLDIASHTADLLRHSVLSARDDVLALSREAESIALDDAHTVANGLDRVAAIHARTAALFESADAFALSFLLFELAVYESRDLPEPTEDLFSLLSELVSLDRIVSDHRAEVFGLDGNGAKA